MRSLYEWLRRWKPTKAKIEGLAEKVVPVLIVGHVADDQDKPHRLSDQYLPVEEKKNSYIWEKAFEKTAIDADQAAGTRIFDGRSAGNYINLDDCDMWAFVVYRQSGGAGVATVDVSVEGSMDGIRWVGSGYTYTNIDTTIRVQFPGTNSQPGCYFGRYESIRLQVNTQGADLFTVELWRRRKQ